MASGYNTIGVPQVADGLVYGGSLVLADTQSPSGSSPQTVALTVNQIGGGALAVVAAAGATQGNATAFPVGYINVQVTVTASTEGVLLPAAATGRVRRVFVPGTVGVKVYPQLHQFIDTGASNASVTLAAGKGSMFIATDTTHWKTMIKGA
jgi:hypothetical protein